MRNEGDLLKMGRIVLARHGQDEDNRDGILNGRRDKPLTLLGLRQAVSLAYEIKNSGLKIEKVFSSKLTRAQQSATIVSAILAVEHIALDFLIERCHGILEGHHYSDIPKLASKWSEHYGFTYIEEVEGGEDYPALCSRAKLVLAKLGEVISSLEIKGDVLVISHGAISRAMQIVHAGFNHEHIFNATSFGNCEFRILE
jgi:broad specificity phosphatase PhoE